MTPVYKKGEHYKASNYRPISLTSICCKVLEHVLVSNIMAHWEKYNVLVPNQHGFRGKRSCESQLIELTDELSKNIDQGYQTDVIVLDFAKAFDRVNHSLLCEKIKSYGITGKTNEWIQSFLNERKQKVVIDGESSETINVRSGVPQGSVLGPCLFLAYINDLPDKVSSNSRLFADDTAVDRKITSTEDQMTLQRDLDSLAQWENEWDMAFHPDKCEVLQVTSKRDKLSHTYKLHNQDLKVVASTKYLGVTLEENCKFDAHINATVNAGNKMLGFIRRNIKVNSQRTKEMAYKMLVRPKVEYAASVWDPYTKSQISNLEKIQRRAARFVLNDHKKCSSVTNMLKSLKWPSLEQRRKATRLTNLYKVKKDKVKIQCKELEPAPTRARRAHDQQLRRLQCKKEIRQHSFFPRTIKEWNELNQAAVSAPSADAFRRHVLWSDC